MDGLGIFDLSSSTWEEAKWWFSVLQNDGWEILAIKCYPDGVYLFAKEVITDFIESRGGIHT